MFMGIVILNIWKCELNINIGCFMDFLFLCMGNANIMIFSEE